MVYDDKCFEKCEVVKGIVVVIEDKFLFKFWIKNKC